MTEVGRRFLSCIGACVRGLVVLVIVDGGGVRLVEGGMISSVDGVSAVQARSCGGEYVVGT